MTLFIIFVLIMALVLALTVRFVRSDGYGHRNPPSSRDPWSFDGLPSEPYRSLR